MGTMFQCGLIKYFKDHNICIHMHTCGSYFILTQCYYLRLCVACGNSLAVKNGEMLLTFSVLSG